MRMGKPRSYATQCLLAAPIQMLSVSLPSYEKLITQLSMMGSKDFRTLTCKSLFSPQGLNIQSRAKGFKGKNPTKCWPELFSLSADFFAAKISSKIYVGTSKISKTSGSIGGVTDLEPVRLCHPLPSCLTVPKLLSPLNCQTDPACTWVRRSKNEFKIFGIIMCNV